MPLDKPVRTPPEPGAGAHRGRRTAIVAGATAALGVAGAALAAPAAAAAGAPVVLGRRSSSGGSRTTVVSTNPASTVRVVGSGGTGVIGDTDTALKWGVHGRNHGAAAAPGTTVSRGGVRGEGRHAVGVRGDTDNPRLPGVWGLGSGAAPDGGAGVVGDGRSAAGVAAFTRARDLHPQPALYADGRQSPYPWAGWFAGNVRVDGEVTADHLWVGAGPVNVEVVSSEFDTPLHLTTGTARLGADGTTFVEWFAFFADAADVATTTVQLTAASGPMPGLWAVVADGGFTINGGTPSGDVMWTATARRRPSAVPEQPTPEQQQSDPASTWSKFAARRPRPPKS
ncbi:hypothetical protein [Kineosporia sp. A_224]|uniref:hypothetical protein n=1 Tax=Kineosporia sp. A_224 TaxID=1962180 RepID=UPI000B4BB66D|nr:hypothetical protein [Kineosporia sp. A_224]